MPTCKYFIAKTFAHIAGGLAVTAVSAQYPIVLYTFITFMGIFGVIIFAILQFILFFLLISAPPNTLIKYAIAVIFVYFIGQLTGPLVSSLKEDNLLIRALSLTTGLFLGMVAVGFFDSQNMLSLQSYVIGALVGIIIIELILDLLIYTNVIQGKTPMRVLTFIGIVIFAMLTGIDVQVLKEHAKICNQSPDYISESMSLFLDFINLFQKIGFMVQSN